MKKTILTIISVLCFCMLTSCEDDSIKMGTVYYYPAFWPTKADTTFLTKTFDFDFNEDAKSENGIFAEFKFVDNEGKSIGPDIMEVYIDGQKLPNNTFRIDNTTESKEIKFRFTPKAESGKHQGYLKLVNHNLDRIDNQLLNKGQQTEVFQWTINFEKKMNPLAKCLMWLAIGIIIGLAIWFVFLKSYYYPRIKLGHIQFDCKEKGYYDNKRINGARTIVVSAEKGKQGWINKLFTGKVVFIASPIWTNTWEMTPKDKGRALKVSLKGKYSVSPITTKLENMKEYTITNKQTNDKIITKIL